MCYDGRICVEQEECSFPFATPGRYLDMEAISFLRFISFCGFILLFFPCFFCMCIFQRGRSPIILLLGTISTQMTQGGSSKYFVSSKVYQEDDVITISSPISK